MIYGEFWYFFRIFPTLFSQLISIFMSLLHTFSMGVKTDARLPRSERFASIMRSRVLSSSCGTRRRIRTITKMGVSRFEHYEFVDHFQPRGSAHFFQWLYTPALTGGSRKTPLRIMEASRSLLAKSRIDYYDPSYRYFMYCRPCIVEPPHILYRRHWDKVENIGGRERLPHRVVVDAREPWLDLSG